MRRWIFKGLGAIAALALAVVLAGWALSSPTPPQPETLVGHQTLTLTPAHREVPVTLHLWYPAEQDGIPGLIGHNALFLGTWKAEGATPQPGAHPLVLFSHGSGGNAERLGWFASALAAKGFVVASPNHPGTTSRDSDPFQTPMVWQRTADLTASLDRLLTDPPAGLSIETTNITAAGFSLGGHSALALGGARLSKAAFIAYCDQAKQDLDCGWMTAAGVDFTTIDAPRYEANLSDARITRVIAIDPALTPAMTPESLTKINHPTLILNLGTPETLPLGLNAAPAAALIPKTNYSTLPGARHFSFLASCSRLGQIIIGLAGEDNICTDHDLRPRADVHADLLAQAIAFLTRP
jgi:predicted dienelactone hydrolase